MPPSESMLCRRNPLALHDALWRWSSLSFAFRVYSRRVKSTAINCNSPSRDTNCCWPSHYWRRMADHRRARLKQEEKRTRLDTGESINDNVKQVDDDGVAGRNLISKYLLAGAPKTIQFRALSEVKQSKASSSYSSRGNWDSFSARVCSWAVLSEGERRRAGRKWDDIKRLGIRRWSSRRSLGESGINKTLRASVSRFLFPFTHPFYVLSSSCS